LRQKKGEWMEHGVERAGGIDMKSTGEIGLKITSGQREFYRYTGASAALEQRGAGSSRPALAWVQRQKREREELRAASTLPIRHD
jgi:hypothetical protein